MEGGRGQKKANFTGAFWARPGNLIRLMRPHGLAMVGVTATTYKRRGGA